MQQAAISPELKTLGFQTAWSEDLTTTGGIPARIARLDRSRAWLWGVDREYELDLALYPRKYELAVGDWMLLDMHAGDCVGGQLLPRFSCISRRAAGERADHQLIAANINTLFIVSSCNQDFSLERLERYLVLALDAGVTPVVVLTKADQVTDADDYVVAVQALQTGLDVLAINACDPAQANRLLGWCGEGQTVALLGSSGVGKSTLTNRLCEAEDQATQQARAGDAKGRHTTVARSLHRMASGGLIIDTPGMRELQLPGCADGVAELFEDVEQFLGQCKFNDCAHQGEPGCAIQAAIASGQLDQRRWRSYEKLQREQAQNAQSIAERSAAQKQLGKTYRAAQYRARKNKGR